ncbi:hypothetical protein [Sphingosinicella sp. CPCC 101087]|uniref:hypothetical protein n=1 Tax=Sphingosinicella sp. CPCC 101087 TaxID=2497754 RepID=UPI00101CDF58|nr:hypothetical protein [Sphingosinicella sp. CPCC 101087]
MRLKDRPLKLLTLTLLGTVGLIFFGLGLLDGEVTLRRFGHVVAAEAPARFALVIAGYVLSWGLMAFAWFVVISEWSIDYRPPAKPSYDDPERRRPL